MTDKRSTDDVIDLLYSPLRGVLFALRWIQTFWKFEDAVRTGLDHLVGVGLRQCWL